MSYEDIELPDLGIEDEFYEDEEEEPFEEDMEEFCSHLEEYRTQAVAILQNREKSIDDRIREYLKFCEKLQNVVEIQRKNCGSRWNIFMSVWRRSMNLRMSTRNGWK